MTQEGEPVNGFIHYCINCGTPISPEQKTFRCFYCGSRTFKLKKMQKEIKKDNEYGNQTKMESDQSQILEKNVPIAETTFCDEKSGDTRLETVIAEGVGVLKVDVDGLMKGKPLILSVKKGQYEISVQRLMERVKKR
ncbi:MAG: OapC/ArvC family zinc-ribbon domain-containing protein [Candidatus Jordarchaeum sp.]|uniref:OapC/ArvC family zinc-ribbon domain-containing protein n=1 Tax=Candidatus Jordarchaeum sp. TaxID=2823881 RepID=UPI00404B8853